METEYLIIGAGSAGNVLTRRLLDAGHTVTLVEAGAQDTNPDIAHFRDLGRIWHSAQDWDLQTAPQPGANGRRLHLPRGKVMGGSHALNAGIWVRGARQDYDAWAYSGCPGWGWEDVLPYFRKIETFDGGASETRGGEGLLDVRGDFERNPIQEAMVEAAQQAGFPLNPDYNSGDPEGVSRMQLTIRDGKRFNTWHAYLRPVVEQDGLVLVTGSVVRRVILDGGRAVGVELEQDGEIRELRAERVVLCAGAIGSPEILLRSGIGPREHLEEIGLPVLADLPGVGANLHDHLLVPVIFSTDEEHPVPDAIDAPAEVHLFAKSTPDQAVPDTQPIFFSVPMYSEGYGAGEMPGPEKGFTLMAGLVRPQSRGRLRLSGPDPADPAIIDLDALGVRADVEALMASVRHCQAIGAQPALAEEWGAREVWPGENIPADRLEEYVRDSVVTYHHQVGTCAMGTHRNAVVDPRSMTVHGVRNLHVADASVMPMVPTGNTNAPTIMMAEKAADLLLGR